MTVNMGQRAYHTPGPVVPFFQAWVARPETGPAAHNRQ